MKTPLPAIGFQRIAFTLISFFTWMFFACVLAAVHGDQVREEKAPRVYQSSGAVLADLRRRVAAKDPMLSRAIDLLRADADASLTAGPFTIVDKKHPLPGIDPHEYVSLARYFWPDPTKPDGLPYISRDGETNPEIDEYDAKPLREMSAHVYTLALAGYLGSRALFNRGATTARSR